VCANVCHDASLVRQDGDEDSFLQSKARVAIEALLAYDPANRPGLLGMLSRREE
jgi:hypothetical protein